MGAEYCDERVCLFLSLSLSLSVCVCVCVSVCVSVHDYLRNYASDLHHFLCMFPMAVARFLSGGEVTCYILPVLWMTSCLLINQGCSTLPPS